MTTTSGASRAIASSASHAVRGLADDHEVVVQLEEVAHPPADHRVVVDEQDPDRRAGQRGPVGLTRPPASGSVAGLAPERSPRWRMTAAARIASAPASLDRDEALAEEPGREGDADDRLEEHQDARPRAADGPDPAQERDRRDGGREDAR